MPDDGGARGGALEKEPPVIHGAGEYQYQITNDWPKVPPEKCPICYIGECGPVLALNREVPNLGPRVSIVDNEGQLLARIGDISGAGYEPGQFISPHGIAVDSRGDVYVAEVSATAWPQLRPSEPVPNLLPSLRKMLRVLASRA